MVIIFLHDLYNWLNCMDFKFHVNTLICLLFIAKMPGIVFFLSVGSFFARLLLNIFLVWNWHLRYITEMRHQSKIIDSLLLLWIKNDSETENIGLITLIRNFRGEVGVWKKVQNLRIKLFCFVFRYTSFS